MLTGTNITIKGIYVKNIASSLTIIPFSRIASHINLSLKPKKPQNGDIALFKVSPKNKKIFITMQDMEGRIINLYPGDYIISPFAPRQSTTHTFGILPDRILTENDEMNLLSDGGSVGEVTYIPPFMGKPTMLEFIAYLSIDNKVLNLKNFAPIISAMQNLSLPPVILIIGTSSEIGKTTLASRIMHLLAVKHQKKVSSLMLSCSGSKSDEIHHQAAGVSYINSFIQMGLPVTYDVAENEYLKIMEFQFQTIADQQKPLVIVGEVGGDFIWGNNQAFLRKSRVMKFVKHLIIISSDVVSAIGTQNLFAQWKIKVPLSFANSWLRSFEGMRIRYEKLLGKKLIDVQNTSAIEIFVDNLVEEIF